MIIQQFIKRLNKVDTQQTNTKERYLRISPKALPDQIFPNLNGKNIAFFDINSGETKNLKFSIVPNNERRIALAKYFKKDEVLPGDEILVERREDGSTTNFYIDLNIKENMLVFEKKDSQFECINYKRFLNILNSGSYVRNIIIGGKICDLEITEIIENRITVQDVSNKQGYEYRFYRILINNKNIIDDYLDKTLLEIIIDDNGNYMNKLSDYEWQRFEYVI
jgi:hypothetical protein